MRNNTVNIYTDLEALGFDLEEADQWINNQPDLAIANRYINMPKQIGEAIARQLIANGAIEEINRVIASKVNQGQSQSEKVSKKRVVSRVNQLLLG